MSDTPITKLATDVVVEVWRSVSSYLDLVEAIRSVMGADDVAVAIDSLRKSDPQIS